MIKNILIVVLLIAIFILIPKKKPEPEPKTIERKVTISLPPAPKAQHTYINFSDVSIGQSFVYRGIMYTKTSNEYYYQRNLNDVPINAPLWYPPGYFLPYAVNNARSKFKAMHFEPHIVVEIVQ